MKNILLICLMLVCAFAAGQKMGIFFESGSIINQPLNPQYYSRAYTTYGYYFKAGMDLGIVRKKKWTFGMPVGISYMQMNRKDYWVSVFTDPSYGPQRGYNYNRTNSITGFFGPQFKVSCNRVSVYSNILLNYMKEISNRDYSMDSENGKMLLTSINGCTNSFWNSFVTSCGLGVQYKMKACTLGINSDLYFTRAFGQGAFTAAPFMGNRIWINPGLRFQYNLK